MKRKLFVLVWIVVVSVTVIACDNAQVTTNSIITESDVVNTSASTTITTESDVVNTSTSTIITTKPTTTEPVEEIFISNEADYVVRNYHDGVEIIAYQGSDELIEIPHEVSGLTVLRIGNYAFNKNEVVKKISIPDSISEIGDFAFNEAVSLVALELPVTIVSIGENITKDCSVLKEISIPEGNDYFFSIGGILFQKMREDVLTLSTESNEAVELFIYPQAITEEFYEIPEGIEAIGAYAFKGNQYLKEVIISETVTYIGIGAFMYCTALETLAVPSSATNIPLYMCYGCESLTNLSFSEGLENIGSQAFNGCRSLSNLSFPESLLHIGTQAFENIGDITEVYLPDQTVLLGGSAFSLNQTLIRYAISDTNKTYTVEDGVLYTADFSALVAYPSGKLETEYTVHEQTIEIATGAFQGNYYLETIYFSGEFVERFRPYSFAYCQSLKTVFIPNNVEMISYNAFYHSTAIEEFVVSEDSVNFVAVDGVLYSLDLTTLYFYPVSKSGAEYEILSSTTRINDIAFLENQYIERIYLTENVEFIKGGAFAAMFSLTEINVSEENQFYTSVDGVLYTKDMKTLMTYPSNINAETFDIPESVETLYYGAFEGNNHLRYLVIPNTVLDMKSYAFQQCSNLEWVIIPSSIVTISRNITTEASNIVVYFEGAEVDYSFFSGWNLDNRPYYFMGEWTFDETNEPVLSNGDSQLA